ncbi:MAG: dockerin type I domain-containing protein [Ruminococcus callidus]|nr:dockerin type I domain-containing protein [Ruminococcus callidus]
MQNLKKQSLQGLAIWVSILFTITILQLFPASAAETAPFPIAWQQSEEAGAEWQRQTYLPEEENWCDYPWNRGSETGNTVGLAGCSLLSVVNSVYYKTGTFINPAELAQFALDNGYRIPGVDGAAMGFFPAVAQVYAERSHMTFQQWTSNAETVLLHVQNGGTACANIVGHWVAIVDYDAETDQYLMLDSSQTSKRAANINWTDRQNGVAWLSATELLANGKSGYYGINGRYSALYTFDFSWECLQGDANDDGQISIEDACIVLEYYANTAAGIDMPLHQQAEQNTARLTACDVNGDGIISIEDATAILSYYAILSTGLEADWNTVLANNAT